MRVKSKPPTREERSQGAWFLVGFKTGQELAKDVVVEAVPAEFVCGGWKWASATLILVLRGQKRGAT